ncbi:dynein intermediate chain Dic1 [Schizosaccharomyces japonicus yFS275]|uniref:Dynein intermediate chain Dic1 n=1 Tax=Schizosaccharomyces japonicus (strain yFS275 / FY16936) TaxID=402676 RepID=B6K0K5_SCHJY|nr:dynein intermediate chain Dic1 [Schizosaccharomyces japonicus yFS275]EEB07476.1 dynein intermediate chain Dic1 [Schizosaccharomyces japonicus yFS275]
MSSQWKKEIAKRRAKLLELQERREQRRKGRVSELSVHCPRQDEKFVDVDSILSELLGPNENLLLTSSKTAEVGTESIAFKQREQQHGRPTLAQTEILSLIQQPNITLPKRQQYNKSVQVDTVQQTDEEETDPNDIANKTPLSEQERLPQQEQKDLPPAYEPPTTNKQLRFAEESELEEKQLHINTFLRTAKKRACRALMQNVANIFAEFNIDDEGDEGIEVDQGMGLTCTTEFTNEKIVQNRAVNGVAYSLKHDGSILAAYTSDTSFSAINGLVAAWNPHLLQAPEYTLQCESEVITIAASPAHAHIVCGGANNGQLYIWDIRQGPLPVLSSSLLFGGHSMPVCGLQYSSSQAGSSIISCSTDGTVKSWESTMLTRPAGEITLVHTEQASNYQEPYASTNATQSTLSPSSMALCKSNKGYITVGLENGCMCTTSLLDVVTQTDTQKHLDPTPAHSCFVTGVDISSHFDPDAPSMESDYVLTSGLDAVVRLWSLREEAEDSETTSVPSEESTPLSISSKLLHEFPHEDIVFDVKWNPIDTDIWASVDGNGCIRTWSIANETKPMLAKATTREESALNRLAWEPRYGNHIACGGLSGKVHVYQKLSG